MATNNTEYDVVIIGAGHNGLTTAGYLCRAGYKVKVVEQRDVVGGAAVTEEFHPGFRNSVCSYVVGLLNPKIVKDLELYKYGLEIMMAEQDSVFIPKNDGGYFLVTSDDEEMDRQIDAISPQDKENWHKLHDILEQCADVVRDVVLETPANIGGGLGDIMRLGKVANRVRKLDADMQHYFAKMMVMSVQEFLDEWLESDLLKASLSSTSFIGTMASPYSPGTAYVLLHHYFGEIDGEKGAWGHAKGGMGSITQAMAKSAQAFGADIEVSAPVQQVIIENGIARGVELNDGRKIYAKVIAANTNPKLLFNKLVASEHLEPEFLRRMNNYRCISGTFRMNVAISEMPKFTCIEHLPEQEQDQILKGMVSLSPSMEHYEIAFNDAIRTGWSKEPSLEVYIPSTLDDTLAPEGQHVMSLFCQHFNPNLPDGQSWDDIREQVADHIIDHLNKFAPNFKASIVGKQIKSPLDLEREFGLVGGDIFHGVLAFDQMYSMRPTSGYADYRMPVKNLYLCGSGAHPGGGVSGCPGHNAAREIMKDFKWRRLA
ncbi:NAD(P)/FAD-dependent oxidoreductase [Thalassotalea psychrophila]|uniref:Pyridine nucleotide-disulfide oxidoreductase domain-containing protein 2 n=1 Tax=Thalassotalea psychrophila TaxID=3065647 RepID=A0ABY9TT50_9GAMM|nr:NAD(P)/FAD-dependent oxidoreductase [Colwelliaceae bacterium SQ149]